MAGYYKVRELFLPLFFYILLFCCVFALLLGTSSHLFAQSPVRVLIINSHHQGFARSESIINGLTDILKSSISNMEIYVEHLDTKRHSPRFMFPLAERLLRAKYEHLQPDIIFTVDDAALKFLMVKKPLLFPDAPLVFCGVNSMETAKDAKKLGMTGVVESTDFEGVIELALSMHPDTQHIALVSDSTLTGFTNLNSIRLLTPKYKNRLDFIELFNLTKNELVEQLKGLPDHTVVILLSFLRDREEEIFSPLTSGQLVSQSTNAPVYTAWDFMVAGGVLGGQVISGHVQGETAAKLGVKILSGEQSEEMDILRESPNVTMFDYAPMQRFGLSSNKLPPSTVILNKPSTPFEKYKKFFITLALIITGLSLVVLILMVNIIRRRKAEDALEKQVLFLETLLDTIPHPIYFKDFNGILLGCNNAFSSLHGVRRQDLVGKNIYENSEILKSIISGIPDDTVINKGELETKEITLTSPEDETSYFVLNRAVFQDQYGNNAGVVGVMVDLTGQILTQEALKRAEEEYRLIFENAPLGIFRSTKEGKYLFANQHLAKIYGYESVEELISEVTDIDTQIYINPEDRKRLLDVVNKEGMLTNMEARVKRKDGSPFWTSRSIRVERDETGIPLYYDGFVMDINDRKEAEFKLRLDEAKSESLFRLSQMMDNDSKQIQRFALQQAVENTGSTMGFLAYLQYPGKDNRHIAFAGDVPESLPRLFNQKDDLLKALGNWALPLEQNKPLIFNDLISESQETDIPQVLSDFRRLQCVPFFRQQTLAGLALVAGKNEEYRDGDLRFLVLVLDTMGHLLTRKEGEQALLKAKEAAEAASLSKNEFLANMSHEIRTPLNGILGMTDLILQSKIASKQREQLEMVRDAGRSLLRVLNDILDLSKIEAGRLDLDLAPFELDTLLDSVVRGFALEAQHKGIELSLAVDPETQMNLRGDAGRLRQVLVNIVGNGIKFTDEGSVRIQVEPENANNFRDKKGTCLIRFTIQDTGCGVPKDMLERIFQNFTQGDASHARKHTGTGLGLAISKRLVQLMGGQIWVDKTSESGSVFVVIIPFESTQKIEKKEPLSPHKEPPPASALTILLAEDNRINQLYAKHILEQGGHTVLTADNGHEALEILSKKKVDLIFMDISMPELDGLETTERIRSGTTLNGNVPIVALTAHAMKGDKERFIKAGMDGYLSKPVEPPRLLESISEAIKHREAISSGTS